MRNLLIVVLLITVGVFAFQNNQMENELVSAERDESLYKDKYDRADDELQYYKDIYDGIIVFEDGSWMFKEGEYYEFWNWDD